MDSALYEWYINYHFILGNNVNIKLFKRNAMKLSNNENLEYQKDGLKNIKKDIIFLLLRKI